MEYVTSYYDGVVEAVPCGTAVRTMEKYMGLEGVETSYMPAVKNGFVVDAQADTMPYIRMYVTPATMRVLLDMGLITYICTYRGTYEEQCAEMDSHPDYPQDGKMYWWIGCDEWQPVDTWEDMVAWTAEYRAQIGEDNWHNNLRMRPRIVAYAGGYEVLAHGVELAPYTYAGTCGTYVTVETGDRLVAELGYHS